MLIFAQPLNVLGLLHLLFVELCRSLWPRIAVVLCAVVLAETSNFLGTTVARQVPGCPFDMYTTWAEYFWKQNKLFR